MAVYRIAESEMPQDRSAIDTGDFTATVGEFDAPEGARELAPPWGASLRRLHHLWHGSRSNQVLTAR
jgi:hypothetical protein